MEQDSLQVTLSIEEIASCVPVILTLVTINADGCTNTKDESRRVAHTAVPAFIDEKDVLQSFLNTDAFVDSFEHLFDGVKVPYTGAEVSCKDHSDQVINLFKNFRNYFTVEWTEKENGTNKTIKHEYCHRTLEDRVFASLIEIPDYPFNEALCNAQFDPIIHACFWDVSNDNHKEAIKDYRAHHPEGWKWQGCKVKGATGLMSMVKWAAPGKIFYKRQQMALANLIKTIIHKYVDNPVDAGRQKETRSTVNSLKKATTEKLAKVEGTVESKMAAMQAHLNASYASANKATEDVGEMNNLLEDYHKAARSRMDKMEKQLNEQKTSFTTLLNEQKTTFVKQLNEQNARIEQQKQDIITLHDCLALVVGAFKRQRSIQNRNVVSQNAVTSAVVQLEKQSGSIRPRSETDFQTVSLADDLEEVRKLEWKQQEICKKYNLSIPNYLQDANYHLTTGVATHNGAQK